MTLRQPDAVLSGHWEFPGGKVEPGEAVADAVRRELHEELAIEVHPVVEIARSQHTYDHGSVVLHAWVCQWLAGEVRHHGVADHAWVPVAEVATYKMPAGNAPITQAINTWAESQSEGWGLADG